MPLSPFERFLPWTGVIAGLAWIAQDFLFRVQTSDVPGRGSVEIINDHLGLNTAGLSCLVVMGVSLLFFATAVRNLLRSGEAREATYSSVAYGGWLIVSAALGQMAVWTKGLMSAAEDGDQSATYMLSYAQYFGWLGMGIGIAAAFIAVGLGGLRNAVLPRWFAITTTVMGVLALLGACSIPPGGLVNYLLLPFWLITAAIIIARRQKDATGGKEPDLAPATARSQPPAVTRPDLLPSESANRGRGIRQVSLAIAPGAHMPVLRLFTALLTTGACLLLGVTLASPAASAVVDAGTETEPIDFVATDFCDVEGLTVRAVGALDIRWRAVPHGPDGNVYYVANGTRTLRYTNVVTGAFVDEVVRTLERDQSIVVEQETLLIEVLATGVAKVRDESGKLLGMDPGQVRFLLRVPHSGTPTDPSDDGEAEFVGTTRESTGRSDPFCEAVVPTLTS
jgi:hypothetical protein